MMQQRRGGIPAFIWVVVALGAFSFLVWSNMQGQEAEAVPVSFIIPTEVPQQDTNNAWQDILRAGFGDNSTPLPTVALPTQEFVVPTLVRSEDSGVIQINPGQVGGEFRPTATPFNAAVTPTPAPTLGAQGTVVPVTVISVTGTPVVWNPPPLIPPLSRDALGRDHYWFVRPVDSNANNKGIFYYPFGSDGPEDESPWRVHHGIDMPNPIGETVRAAGSGRVIWAADGLRIESDGFFQNSPSYGNVIVIQHDFGYRGAALYTLYAHLSGVLVRSGQEVQTGDVIGLVGESGRVSGPHVHFEVRLGEDAYAATYNPALWMVPYVGTGVIAGSVTDRNGNWVQDANITVRDWRTGLNADTTTSYVFVDTGFDINPDPNWRENFVVGDVPVGRYEVIAIINGERVSRIVDVLEGTTTFVELSPRDIATPRAVSDGNEAP